MLGTSIGNYTVTARIGEGGMGTVYLAEHALLGRRAAVKVLLPQLSNHRDTVARFFNEARAATAIRHPGIVEIFDFGYLPNGNAYIVMEYLEGETLAARRTRVGRFEATRAMALVRQIAGALAAAHDRGIVHRDLKPDNVFVVADPEVPGGERIKILDFGIAKLVGDKVDVSRTQTGTVLGTPTYISPEQCRGTGEVDARADLYALGCVSYELVCGHPPFVVDGAGELIAHHLYFDPASPRSLEPRIPETVDHLILWLLRKQPQDRPQSARALIEAIDQLSGAAAAAGTGGPGHTPVPRAPSAPPVRPTPVPTPQPMPPAVQAVALLPAQSTTLSAASGMALSRSGSPRPRWLIPAVAAVTATAGIAIVLVASGGRGPASSPPSIAPAAREAAQPAPVPPKPIEPAKPVDVHLTVDSDPSGATVLVDGKPIGTTPLDDRVAAGAGRRSYTIIKDGYEPATVALDTGHDGARRVVLEKHPAKPAAPEPSLGDRGVNPFDH